jgi:hypothetical protein
MDRNYRHHGIPGRRGHGRDGWSGRATRGSNRQLILRSHSSGAACSYSIAVPASLSPHRHSASYSACGHFASACHSTTTLQYSSSRRDERVSRSGASAIEARWSRRHEPVKAESCARVLERVEPRKRGLWLMRRCRGREDDSPGTSLSLVGYLISRGSAAGLHHLTEDAHKQDTIMECAQLSRCGLSPIRSRELLRIYLYWNVE